MREETRPPAPREVQDDLDRLAEQEGFWETDLHYHPESPYRILLFNGSQAVDPFTGSSEVRKGRRAVLRPFAASPPQTSRSQALKVVRRRLRWAWLAPGRIRRQGRKEENLRGVLIPFWIFDFTAVAHFPAQGPSAGGTLQKHFSDLIVSASQALSQGELGRLKPLSAERIMPFRKTHFPDFYQEHYSKNWKEAFQEAALRAERQMEIEYGRSPFGSKAHGQIEMRYMDIAFKLILMPVWILAFPFKDGFWRALIDAQSGQIHAQVPRSPLRIASLAVLLVAFLLWLLI